MTVSVKVTKDKTKKVIGDISKLALDEVLIGIPAETSARSGEPITNADLGYIHEFGAPGANIPARPFLIPGVKMALGKAIATLKRGASSAVSGDTTAISKALHSAGTVAEMSVKRKITDGPFAPLSERTKAARRAKHNYAATQQGSDFVEMRPLIDTGQLRKAITYVVRRKGK